MLPTSKTKKKPKKKKKPRRINNETQSPFENYYTFVRGGLAALTGFASCDNFLKNGEDVRKEVEDVIAYNNAQECNVVFQTASNMGSFLGSLERKLKVGYESEVQFELNTQDYVFKGFAAVSQNDKNADRSNCVQFTEISSDDKKGVYKYKIKLLTDAKDIQIIPVCIALPKVTITPAFESNGCDQDTEIKFTFNKPMNQQKFLEAAVISIYSENETLTKTHFSDPYFSNDGTVLYIRPNENKILPPDGDKNSASVFINYDFSKTVDEDGLAVELSGTYEYRIRKEFHGQKIIKIYAQGSDGIYLSLNEGLSIPCTVGCAADISFSLDTSSYDIEKMEAVSYDDQSLSVTDVVQVEAVEDKANPGKYQAHVWVKDDTTDILVKINTVAFPVVEDYQPKFKADGITTEKPIIISFSMPMEESVKDKVKLEIFGEDVSDYFEEPQFNTDRTQLTITPKYIELRDYIQKDMKAAFADVNIYFEKSASAKIGEKTYLLKQDSKTNFTLRYKNDKENNLPERVDFFVTSSPVTLETAVAVALDDARRFTQEELNIEADTTDSRLINNLSCGELYIYGNFLDTDSGVQSVKIGEKKLRKNNGDKYYEEETIVGEYFVNGNYPNAQFRLDNNGNTYFCIRHEISSKSYEDTIIQIFVHITDGCENTTTENLYVVKDLYLFDKLPKPYNYPKDPEDLFDYDEPINIDNYNAQLRNIKITSKDISVYGNVIIPKDTFSYYCKYAGNTEPQQLTNFTTDQSGTKTYNINLVSDSVSDLEFEIIYKINYGLQYTRKFKYPSYIFPLDWIHEEDGLITVKFMTADFLGFSETPRFYAIQTESQENSKIVTQYYGRLKLEQDQENSYTYNFFYDNEGLCGELIPYNTLVQNCETGIEPVGIKSCTQEFDGISQIVVTVELEDDVWDKFDCIYHRSYAEYVTVPKNTFVIKRYYSVESLANMTDSFYIGGMNKFSVTSEDNESSINVSRLSEEEIGAYDTDFPAFYAYIDRSNDYNAYLVLRTLDYGSGVKHVKYSIGSTTVYEQTYNERSTKDEKKISLPEVINLAKESLTSGIGKEINVNYEITDRVDHYAEGIFTVEIPFTKRIAPVTITNDGTNLIITGKTRDVAYGDGFGDLYHQTKAYEKMKFYFKYFNDGVWAGNAGGNKLTYNSEADNYSCSIQNNSTFFPLNKFYKIEGSYTNYEPAPQYYYFGDQNSGECDFIFKNGNLKNSFIISSDAPVFVHTLATIKPYSECSDWSIDEWEQFHKEIAPKLLKYDTNPAPKRYDVPLNELKDYQCYCVIAWFADGSYIMSEVYEK